MKTKTLSYRATAYLATVLLVLMISLQAQQNKNMTAQTISSTTDRNGNQHPASAAISGPSQVTCVSASGNDPRNYPPSCNVSAPGYNGAVNPRQTVGTSGAGTVRLTCNGQAPLACTATIR